MEPETEPPAQKATTTATNAATAQKNAAASTNGGDTDAIDVDCSTAKKNSKEEMANHTKTGGFAYFFTDSYIR